MAMPQAVYKGKYIFAWSQKQNNCTCPAVPLPFEEGQDKFQYSQFPAAKKRSGSQSISWSLRRHQGFVILTLSCWKQVKELEYCGCIGFSRPSLEPHIIPSAWKKGVILPIFKKGDTISSDGHKLNTEPEHLKHLARDWSGEAQFARRPLWNLPSWWRRSRPLIKLWLDSLSGL